MIQVDEDIDESRLDVVQYQYPITAAPLIYQMNLHVGKIMTLGFNEDGRCNDVDEVKLMLMNNYALLPQNGVLLNIFHNLYFCIVNGC